MNKLILLFLIFFYNLSVSALNNCSNNYSVDNIETFGRLYGYVKYFHPISSETQIDWDALCIYGVKKVKNASTNDELLIILNDIFCSITPSIKIYLRKRDPGFKIKKLIPKDPLFDKFMFWEHQGLGLGMSTKFFSSGLKEIKCDSIQNENYPKFGEYIKADVGNGLVAYIPLVLYCYKSKTYPVANTNKFHELKDTLNYYSKNYYSGDSLDTRLADVIIYWNVFKHFFPHFSEKQREKWDDDFKTFLNDAINSINKYGFLRAIERHISLLNDGHAIVRLKNDTSMSYFAPLTFAWIENSLIVSEVCDTTISKLRRGDIVLEINKMKSLTYLDSIEQYLSASTFHYKRYLSSYKLKLGSENSNLNLKIKRGEKIFEDTLLRSYRLKDFNKFCPKEYISYKEIMPNIFYIDLGIITRNQLDSLMPSIANSKGIIFDVRYPGVPILSHLINYPDTCDNWWRVPIIHYPDYSKISLIKRGWMIKPEEPFFRGKIIFISRSNCISHAESLLSYVKSYKLGTIVGETTAGTNGDINSFRLPGGYSITWTNAICYMQNGEPYFGKGIEPDVKVFTTVGGIVNHEDELLNRALEIMSNMIE